jgi:integrase
MAFVFLGGSVEKGLQAEVQARAWESTSDRLAAEANTITDLLRELLFKHSSLARGRATRGSLNSAGGMTVYLGPEHVVRLKRPGSRSTGGTWCARCSSRHAGRRSCRPTRFRDLRHSYASVLIEQGAHPKVISDQLGHASVQITIDRYSHLFDGAYSDVSDELEKAWSGAETAAETITTAVVSR